MAVMKIYIYGVFCAAGKCHYVGQTVDLAVRKSSHARNADGFWASLKRPKMKVLHSCESEEEANLAEQKWIAEYRILGQASFNRTPGGSGRKPNGFRKDVHRTP